MEMKASRKVPSDVQTTWLALNDPAVLKSCITGCESLEAVSADEYQAKLAVRIGPVNARFNGKVTLSDRVPPTAYSLSFEGQGGAAGFARGRAEVRLAAHDGGTLIEYAVKADVGGKLAQIGSRLVDGAAQKMSEDFFTCFAQRVADGAVAPEALTMAPTTATGSLEPPPARGEAAGRSMWPRLALAAAIIVAVAGYWILR